MSDVTWVLLWSMPDMYVEMNLSADSIRDHASLRCVLSQMRISYPEVHAEVT